MSEPNFLSKKTPSRCFPFLDNVSKTILHIFRLLLLHFNKLYEVEWLTIFGIGWECNNCITCKHFSSNFLLLLFINVIKVSLSQFLDITLRLCFKYEIRISKMMQILEYQNTFYSDLSGFKCKRYWNDILFSTNYSDLSFLLLSKNGAPSSLASRLALPQVFFYFLLASLSQIWILASYNYVSEVENGDCMIKMLNFQI